MVDQVAAEQLWVEAEVVMHSEVVVVDTPVYFRVHQQYRLIV